MSADELLWKQLKEGDKKALEKIYRLNFSDLYKYGCKFSADKSLVEDAIQELFITIFEKRENLSQIDSIKPYLLISLKRNLINKIKKEKKISDIELEEKYFDVELSLDEKLISNELNEEKALKLKQAITKLSSRQKEALYLKYYSGLDYDEICEIMDLNYQSARNLVSRALLKLTKILTILILGLLNFIENIV